MKRFFLIIFLSSFSLVFGQKLKFDLMAQYSVSNDNSTFERSCYAISSNENFLMQIINRYDGQQVAKVYDLKSLKSHEFTIMELKSENDIKNYKFTYSKTSAFERKIAGNIYFDFQSVSIIENIETVKLSIYKNKSKTKIINSFELKIIKSEINLFPLFRFNCLHPSEFITELSYAGAGIVTNCISENGLRKFTLTAFGEANFELTIPN